MSYQTSLLTYNQAKLQNKELISDYFTDSEGRWLNYATFDTNQRLDLINQRHTDLRTFYGSKFITGYIVDLSTKTMSTLTGKTVGGTDSNSIPGLVGTTNSGESWSVDTVLTYAVTARAISSNVATLTIGTHNIEVNDTITVTGMTSDTQFNGTFVITSVGSTTISFVLTGTDTSVTANLGTVTPSIISHTNGWKSVKVYVASGNTRIITSKGSAIDINNYSSNAYISAALPKFDNNFSLADCYIEITTDTSTSGFDTNQTDKIFFNTDGYLINDGTTNKELKIPTSVLTNTFKSSNTNKGKITGIRFTIKSTTNASFRCSGIRCIASTWKYAPIDINTIETAVVKPFSPTGSYPESILTSVVGLTDTTISVSDSSDFPTTGVILIDAEFIKYTTNSSNTFGGLTRGYYNSTKSSHTNNTEVTGYPYAFSTNTIGNNLPSTWPSIYRSFNAAANLESEDPKLIDATIYATIDLGELAGFDSSSIDANSFAFYFRNGVKYSVQTDLNKLTQSQLNSQKIPDLIAKYVGKNQYDISIIPGVKASKTLPFIPFSGTYQDNSGTYSNTGGTLQSGLSKVPGQYAATSARLGSYANTAAILTSNITDLATTIAVTNSSSLPSSGKVLIESEIITYTGISSNQLTGVVRGTNGTTASSHLANSYVLSYTTDGVYQINLGGITSAGLTQKNLTEIINLKQISYLGTKVRWYKSDSALPDGSDGITFQIIISDELSNIFKFETKQSLNYWRNKTLVFKSTALDDKVQCKLFELKNNQLYLIFDTGLVKSDLFHRTRGEFGWSAELEDGCARIRNIKSGGGIYAEYKSSPINSFTPVRGAQIFTNQSEDYELVSGITANKWTTTTGTITYEKNPDNTSKPIYVITNNGQNVWQGLQTNLFKIENFEDIYMTFDIQMPSDSGGIIAFLYDENNNKIFRLNVPSFNRDKWDFVKLIAYNDQFLPGYYKLVIAQNNYDIGTSWKIKNISIKNRVLNWHMRSFMNNPWQADSENWIQNKLTNNIPINHFTKSSNKNDGALFAKYGSGLQVRAQAINPYAEITNFDVQPSYATLGNFVWRNV
jgi:hypothetical protein